MLKFVLKALLILLITLGLAYASVSALSWWPYRNNKPTARLCASRLEVMPGGLQFNVVILGSSHGECLTIGPSYDTMVAALNRPFFSLAKGNGTGIIPMSILTDYFYHDGNSGKHFLYIMDSQNFFSEAFNENPLFYKSEPFDPYLLYLAVKHHTRQTALASYFQSKYTLDWLRVREDEKKQEGYVTGTLTKVDPDAVKKRIDNMFFDGLDTVKMRHYESVVLDLVHKINAHGGDVTFIIPPTLLGVLPGDVYLQQMLKDWKAKYGIQYLDLSQQILDPTLYYNHDHLNSNGVSFFVRKYIDPLIDSLPANPTQGAGH